MEPGLSLKPIGYLTSNEKISNIAHERKVSEPSPLGLGELGCGFPLHIEFLPSNRVSPICLHYDFHHNSGIDVFIKIQ